MCNVSSASSRDFHNVMRSQPHRRTVLAAPAMWCVVDVSAAGDWSKVKVWYAGNGDLGTTTYPTFGFIYPDKSAVQFAEAGGATMRGATLR